VSEEMSTLVHMTIHMGKTLLRGGVTRNLGLPPALGESTAVLHCRVASAGRTVPGRSVSGSRREDELGGARG